MLHLECACMWRKQLQCLQGLMFFCLSVVFLPFAVGSDLNILQAVGPGYMWIMAIFASLLTADSIFSIDNQSGFLEKTVSAPDCLTAYYFAKLTAYFIFSSVPVILLTPVLSLLYQLSIFTIIILSITLTLGTFILNLFTLLGSILTLPVNQRNNLVQLLILPMITPVLIIGTMASYFTEPNQLTFSYIYLLLAIFLVAMFLLPIASIYLLRCGNT